MRPDSLGCVIHPDILGEEEVRLPYGGMSYRGRLCSRCFGNFEADLLAWLHRFPVADYGDYQNVLAGRTTSVKVLPRVVEAPAETMPARAARWTLTNNARRRMGERKISEAVVRTAAELPNRPDVRLPQLPTMTAVRRDELVVVIHRLDEVIHSIYDLTDAWDAACFTEAQQPATTYRKVGV